jgi:hypothetical protein
MMEVCQRRRARCERANAKCECGAESEGGNGEGVSAAPPGSGRVPEHVSPRQLTLTRTLLITSLRPALATPSFTDARNAVATFFLSFCAAGTFNHILFVLITSVFKSSIFNESPARLPGSFAIAYYPLLSRVKAAAQRWLLFSNWVIDENMESRS